MPQTLLNDIDVIKRIEYIVPPSRVAKKPAPELQSLPAFSPIEIDDYNDFEESNVPLSLDWHDLLALFKLFFEKPRVIAQFSSQCQAFSRMRAYDWPNPYRYAWT